MFRVLTGLAAMVALPAFAAPVIERIDYEIDGTAYESVLVHDDAGAARRPGLLMVPNWLGINETAIARARELAGKDYVVLIADVYGKAVRPADFDEAGKASSAAMADRDALRKRINRALDVFRDAGSTLLQPDRIVALGFCFGGTTVLELARSGADVNGVVSFHGNPGPVIAARKGDVKASILVLHGADDFFVPEESLRAFETEMTQAGADWRFLAFSGARHCFAEREANDQPPGCLYDERAARRAYAALDQFLDEQFGGD